MITTTSIILPSIRPKNLKKWYDAADLASQNNSWEVIIVSPYNLPDELDGIKNIKYIKSKANPTVCKQMGCLLASGKYLFNTTDDAILFPNSIDKMVQLWKNSNLQQYDIINARYREGALDLDLNPLDNLPPELPPEYWFAHHHSSLRQPAIKKEWKISLHFFMLLETFYKIGGLDTNEYEYSVFPILQMCFLLQNYGGQIIDSKDEVSWCSHLPNHSGDHSPIHLAMSQNDENIFIKRFQKNSVYLNIPNKYDNWKRCSQIWGRRFQ